MAQALGHRSSFFAQRSRFCLRSAVIEFARGMPGGKLTVWLFAFAIALVATQGLVFAVAAQASWTGLLSPWRERISAWCPACSSAPSSPPRCSAS